MSAKVAKEELAGFLSFVKDINKNIKTKAEKNKEVKKRLLESKKEIADMIDSSYSDAFDIKE